MKKQKTIYETYKEYFDYGKKFQETNPRIAYSICFYAVNNLKSEYSKNKNCFNEKEKDAFMSEIKNMNSITLENEKTNYDEYVDFLENAFANVNDEDRYGEVTPATAQKFKMLNTLINVIKTWEELNGEWIDKRKKI